jgi:hypothetical protein
MPTQLRRTSFAVLIAVVSAVTAASLASGSNGPAHPSSTTQTLHIRSSKPQPLTYLDFGPKGKSPGDLFVFAATLYSPDGRTVIGRVRGSQTGIKAEHGMETVQGMITYELGTGNQLVVGGLGEYPLKGTGLLKGRTFVRPVLGGSGKYSGATGEVLSKVLPGGGYDQTFKLSYH